MNNTELINELEGLGIYVQSMHVKATFQEYQTISIEGYIKKVEKKMNQLDPTITAIKANAYFIGSVNQEGFFSLAGTPVFHTSGPDARAECKRLSKANPGKMFFIAQMRGAEMVPVTTISI